MNIRSWQDTALDKEILYTQGAKIFWADLKAGIAKPVFK